MRKKLLLLGLCCLMLLSGCSYEVYYRLNPDNSIYGKSIMYYTEDEYNALDDSEKSDLEKTVIDGKTYYMDVQEEEALPGEANDTKSMFLKDGLFYTKGDSSTSSTAFVEEMKISVEFPDAVAYTNGKVDPTNPAIAVFTKENTVCYAYTAQGKALVLQDKTKPTSNIKNKAVYAVMPVMENTDNMVLLKTLLNNKEIAGVRIKTDDSGTVADYLDANGKSLLQWNKENRLYLEDINGNKNTIRFFLDNKAPEIKGVKNNKSYKGKAVFYVKDNIKLQTIKVDNKKQKGTLIKKGSYKNYYKLTVKKKGSHTVEVQDAAGNKKKIKFSVK